MMTRRTLLPLLVLAAGCAGEKGFEPPGPPRVQISPAIAMIHSGEQTRFVAIVSGDMGMHITTAWSSSAEAVATVDSAGLVSGRAPGDALIVVRVSGKATLADTALLTIVER